MHHDNHLDLAAFVTATMRCVLIYTVVGFVGPVRYMQPYTWIDKAVMERLVFRSSSPQKVLQKRRVCLNFKNSPGLHNAV